jgi:hypothetical protein
MKTIHREPRLELSVREKCRVAAQVRDGKRRAIERWENEGGEVSVPVPIIAAPSEAEQAGVGSPSSEVGEKPSGAAAAGSTP